MPVVPFQELDVLLVHGVLHRRLPLILRATAVAKGAVPNELLDAEVLQLLVAEEIMPDNAQFEDRVWIVREMFKMPLGAHS